MTWLPGFPERGYSALPIASNWQTIDERVSTHRNGPRFWFVRLWYRSAWLGRWGDRRIRTRYDSKAEAMDAATRARGPVEWDVFEVVQ